MAENSKIEWTDHTFNPWWGCQKVSPACDHCYAERDAKRFAPGKVLWGVGAERRIFDVTTKAGGKHWQAPLNWARTSPAKLGRRPRVFCASMGDWLDLDAPLAEFVRLLDTIRLTPELDWLLLSKRIGNWRKRLQAAFDVIEFPGPLSAWVAAWLKGDAPANVWLGATVVDQTEADRDIPKLLAVPARVRFLSIEPMLGPVNLDAFLWECCGEQEYTGVEYMGASERICCRRPIERDALHWVIVGGESGPHARPMHPDWVRSVKQQCQAAGVSFFMKQMTKKAEIPADLLVREFPHAA